MTNQEQLNKAAEEYYGSDDLWEDDEPILDDTCPNCNRVYDSIDKEYQICHRCGFNNNTTKTNQQ